MEKHKENKPKIGIVISRFNEFITKKLLDGALETFNEHGIVNDDITIIWVPGCFEIPTALAEMANKNFTAIVCLGVVIRGETPHFDYVAQETSRGISEISQNKKLPVGFGVLTTENTEQAIDRAGGKRGNKGREAATAAIEMIKVLSDIRKVAI